MKNIKLILLLIAIILLTGCWDMVEINQRIYPYSFGVDFADDEVENLSLTITYPNIKAIGKNPSQEDKTYVLNSSGTSIFQAARKLTTEVQGPFYFKHLRVLILGEEVSKDKHMLKQILDGLMRDFIINKRVLVTVVKGEAEKFMELVPNNMKQESLEGTLFGLLLNPQNSTYFTQEYLSEFIYHMDRKCASVVPLLSHKGDVIEAAGGGVFKDYALVGYINGKENAALTMLNGKIKTEVIDADYKGSIITLNTRSIKSDKKLVPNDEVIKIKYNIEIEGSIQEYTLTGGQSILSNPELLNDIKEVLADKVKGDLDNVIHVLQKDIKADALGIAEYLSKFHPKLWKTVEEDWRNVFSDIDIEVQVDVKIRRRGLTN